MQLETVGAQSNYEPYVIFGVHIRILEANGIWMGLAGKKSSYNSRG